MKWPPMARLAPMRRRSVRARLLPCWKIHLQEEEMTDKLLTRIAESNVNQKAALQ